jgi:hypothetical protein
LNTFDTPKPFNVDCYSVVTLQIATYWVLSYNEKVKGRKNQMSKPSVKAVQNWYCQSYNKDVQVYSGSAVFDDDYYKVVVKGKAKYFYGEQAQFKIEMS